MESIPVAETRSYVKRLMLYHWLYRRRFGQDAKSLEETASGAMADLSARRTAGRADAYGLKISARSTCQHARRHALERRSVSARRVSRAIMN